MAFFFPPAIFLFPILFATSLIITNHAYLKYKYSGAVILVLFFFIFLVGSPIFYQVFEDLGLEHLSFMYVGLITFLMVTTVVKLTIKDITIKFIQVLMILMLGLISSWLTYFLQQKFSVVTIEEGGISVAGLIYQTFMTLAIALTLKKSNPYNSMYYSESEN
ncbi:hypothetical protein GCM10008119_30890 [Pedobacter mendelii]|uniref:Uncharacterized protein n=1 Tax=Pedobacter mendelii TaxID=1908240 RepID=A0ABQ2BN26_9SPHI|nr:hypothetical protein GCM10008119_30890 [Pedobacter mendelii]